MSVVASLFVSFLRFHPYGFSFHLCAVDAPSLLRFQATWSHCTDRVASGAPGRSPAPSRVDAQNGNCTRTSSFAVWTEELMVVFRDCADHVDYVSQVANKWRQAVLHKCLPTCPLLSRSTQPRGRLGHPPAQACDLAWLHARGTLPGFHGPVLPPAVLDFPLHRFHFSPLAPLPLSTPHALQEPLGEWICKGQLPPSGACMGVRNQRDRPPASPRPRRPRVERGAGGAVRPRCGGGRGGDPEPSQAARLPDTQLLNQGFSALPLSGGVGCPAGFQALRTHGRVQRAPGEQSEEGRLLLESGSHAS